MSPGVPYVSVRSNDVLNGSLDLVLRLCTRVDTVWRVLRPGREVGFFLLDPLSTYSFCFSYHGISHAITTHKCRVTTSSDKNRGVRVVKEQVCARCLVNGCKMTS